MPHHLTARPRSAAWLLAGSLAALALTACSPPAQPVTKTEPAAEAAPSPAPAPAAPADPTRPPVEWVETGACPFEGCQYGRWTAFRPVTLYERPGGPALARRLAKDDVVTATGGEVRATPVKARVKTTGPEDTEAGIAVGDIVYVLYPLGEGAVMVWKDGKAVGASIDVELEFDPPLGEGGLPYVWWAKVKLADGTVAWVKDASQDFYGTDQFE